MVGVNAGFMEVGNLIGYRLSLFENKSVLLIFGFTLGFDNTGLNRLSMS